jgi:hypothetical protein
LGVGLPLDSQIFIKQLQGSKPIGLGSSLYHWNTLGTLTISKLPFGSPMTKCHLDVGLVERHKVCYKGEGGGFPQVWAVVNLVSPSLPVARPSTKNAPAMH